MVAVPNPVTVAAGSKSLASVWNDDVRDATTYFLENIDNFGHRNGIVNPIFQFWDSASSLAITSSATPQYHAAQWCTRRNGATGATVSRQAGPTGQQYALRIQRDSGNSNTTAIETMQPLETPESYRYAGQTCQFKLALKAGANFSATSGLVTVKVTTGTGTDQGAPASGWTGTSDALSTTQAITTTMTDYEFDVTIPSSVTQVQVSVTWTPVGTASTNDWVEIGGAQLTVGKSSGWERLPYALTLQRCQRFYQVGVGRWNGYSGGAGSAMGHYLPFPVVMRTTPTMVFTDGGSAAGFAAVSTSTNLSASQYWMVRTTTASGGAGYIESWTANARL